MRGRRLAVPAVPIPVIAWTQDQRWRGLPTGRFPLVGAKPFGNAEPLPKRHALLARRNVPYLATIRGLWILPSCTRTRTATPGCRAIWQLSSIPEQFKDYLTPSPFAETGQFGEGAKPSLAECTENRSFSRVNARSRYRSGKIVTFGGVVAAFVTVREEGRKACTRVRLPSPGGRAPGASCVPSCTPIAKQIRRFAPEHSCDSE